MEGSARRARLALGLLAIVAVLAWEQPLRVEARVRHNPACIFDRLMLWTAPGTCRPHARSYPPSVRGTARRAVYDSALTFGIPYPILLRIARCESGLNPHAINGRYLG